MDQKMRLSRTGCESGSIVFLAGVSTESGISDFRSTNGLYRQPMITHGGDFEPYLLYETAGGIFQFTALKCFAWIKCQTSGAPQACSGSGRGS